MFKFRLSVDKFLVGFYFGLFLALQGVLLIEKGVQVWQLGFILGAITISATLFEVPFGATADNYGRLKVYRISRLVYIGSIFLFLLFDDFSFIFAAAILLGLSNALSSGTIDAWYVERLKEKGRMDLLLSLKGLLQAMMAAGMVAGSLTGGYLPIFLGQWGNIAGADWNLIAILFLSIFHLSLTYFLFQEGEEIIQKTEKAPGKAVGKTIINALHDARNNPIIIELLIIGSFIGFILTTIESYWQPKILQFDEHAEYYIFGWISAGYFSMAIIGPILIGILSHNLKLKKIYIVRTIIFILIIFMIATALAVGVYSFIIAYFLFMLFFSMVNPPAFALLNEQVNDENRSTMLSLFSLTFALGAALSAFTIPFLVRVIGISNSWLAASTLIAVFLIFLFNLNNSKLGREQTKENKRR